MSKDQLSDIELVDRVLRSVPGAFELFYRRHSQLIKSCIRKRADARDVDDLFQGFFERLIKNEYRILQVWQRGTSLPIYLATVLRNYVIDFQRRHRREDARGDASDLESFLPQDPLSPANEETITTSIYLRELRRCGIKAWAQLEVRDRKLTCDKLHRGMDNEDIAVRVQLAPGALRTATSRAQVRLLAELRQLAPEFFPDQV